jgi:hypothetical protein
MVSRHWPEPGTLAPWQWASTPWGSHRDRKTNHTFITKAKEKTQRGKLQESQAEYQSPNKSAKSALGRKQFPGSLPSNTWLSGCPLPPALSESS